MKKNRPHITREIDADVAMSVIKSCVENNTGIHSLCTYEFNGVSERTVLGDVLSTSIRYKNNKPRLDFSLKRDSLYHILPEYLFHPLDRYLGAEGDFEEFDKRYKEQKEQEKNALLYFKPFDAKYQELKILYQQWLDNNVFTNQQFFADYVTLGYRYDKENPFIKAVIPCIPWVRDYRGNREMIETSLDYAFKGNAEISVNAKENTAVLSDNVHCTLNGSVDDLYCGDTIVVQIKKWNVKYQTHITTKTDIERLEIHIAEFLCFFQEWFLSVEETLIIEFGDWKSKPLLSKSEDKTGIFLNYSTQLI